MGLSVLHVQPQGPTTAGKTPASRSPRFGWRTAPSRTKITGNPRGNLVLDPDVSGHFVLSDDGEDGYAHIIGLDFRWNNPDNSHHNDYDDANEKFAGFRVRFRTVDPPGHAVQEKFVRADFIIPGDAPTTASWRAALEANGYDHAKRFAPNRPNRKYEWSVVPVDRHWNNVEAERVTRCVLMTGNTLDLTANPICPRPAAGRGGQCARTVRSRHRGVQPAACSGGRRQRQRHLGRGGTRHLLRRVLGGREQRLADRHLRRRERDGHLGHHPA